MQKGIKFIGVNKTNEAKHLYIHIYIKIHIYTHAHIYTHIYTHTNKDTYIHMHTYMHKHTYMHDETDLCSPCLSLTTPLPPPTCLTSGISSLEVQVSYLAGEQTLTTGRQEQWINSLLSPATQDGHQRCNVSWLSGEALWARGSVEPLGVELAAGITCTGWPSFLGITLPRMVGTQALFSSSAFWTSWAEIDNV